MRLQRALNVHDLDEAVEFYGKRFNAKPHKLGKGYANFAIDAPPLKLVLFENAKAAGRLNHLGVEVFDQAEVDAAERRFADSRILDAVEDQALCCHAVQNKLWAREPPGLKWEWYRITDDSPADPPAGSQASTCCAGQADIAGVAACCQQP